MLVLPPKVRSQITALGLRSRPLGEERAKQLAAGLILALVQELRGKGDCERVVRYYEDLIDREVAAATVSQPSAATFTAPAKAQPNPGKPSWSDLLPEYA